MTDLDELVTAVATTLMGTTSAGLKSAAEDVLHMIVDFLQVDLSFLRFHDLERRATILIAEWPQRPHVPDPDPLGVVYFATADPVFAATEHLSEVGVRRPSDAADYQERVRQGSGVDETSVAMVPLRTGDVTTGGLGFIKYGDRGWDDAELRALKTIALLFAQIQGRIAAEDRLSHLAHHDELTGLANRRALLSHLHGVLESRHGEPRALLFIDVDRLKAMNDFLGHEAGDRFIATIADRLRSSIEGNDVVARLGGDEFVIALDGPADDVRAFAAADRIRTAVSAPLQLGGQILTRTISIGVAVAGPECVDLAHWLRCADQAVLTAKKRGGNEIVSFTADMFAREQTRVAIEMTLPAAIRSGSLTIAYQPIVDMASRATVGLEALARWNHPTLGPISPELFVGIAETTNLAGELGEWVLEEACRQLAAWRATLPASSASRLTMSVNVSPVQLIAIDFCERVGRILRRHGLSGRHLVIEVTEHTVVTDDAAALRTLNRLRAMGVAIAIDDFGTGYSSMTQLKAFPVNILKIDRSFVLDLATNADDYAIVQSIVKLAEAFHLDIVAEGVECESAAAILTELGCHKAQGYLFAPPRPPDITGEGLALGTEPGKLAPAQSARDPLDVPRRRTPRPTTRPPESLPTSQRGTRGYRSDQNLHPAPTGLRSDPTTDHATVNR